MFLLCVILELATQKFISFQRSISTDGFTTIFKLSINRRQASIRVMKIITTQVRRIYVGMTTGRTGS